jgi:tetratricopeptide (TPR) repeat protein
MTASQFRYDFAFSLAGEKRRMVRRLTAEMRRLNPGVRIFFDEDSNEELWGKTDRDLREIYASSSRYVVPIISQDYATSDWTRLEFEAAKEAERKRGDRVLLPIRCDDTTFLGLSTNVIHSDARKLSTKELAGKLISTLTKEVSAEVTSTPAPRISIEELARWLAGSNRRALGLLAIFEVIPDELLLAVFPEIAWKRIIRDLHRSGIATVDHGMVQVHPLLAKSILKDEEETKRLRSNWRKALFPIRLYPDIALLYASVCFEMGDVKEGLDVLVTVGGAAEDPDSASLYAELLAEIATSARFEQFEIELRLRVINAVGLCMTHLECFDEAVQSFHYLRLLGQRSGNTWAIGQSLINEGVVHARAGRLAYARVLYETTAEHARRTGNVVLRGRALGNLAMVGTHQPERAAAFLRESLAAKRASRDRQGLFAGWFASGLLEAQAGKWAEAARYFERAARVARRSEREHDEAFALVHQGDVQASAGRLKAALKIFQKARRIVRALPGTPPALILAIQGEAVLQRERKQWRAAERLFRVLIEMKERRGDRKGALEAAHDLALLLEQRSREAEARQLHEKTAAQAMRLRLFEFACVCLIAAANIANKEDSAGARALLRRAQAAAERGGNIQQRVEVAFERANLEANNARPAQAEALLRAAQPLAVDTELKLLLLQSRVELLLRARRMPEALRLFSGLQRTAMKSGHHQVYVDSHMLVGDYLWWAGKEFQLEACQAYAAALLYAVSESKHLGDPAFIKVGMRMAQMLVGKPVESYSNEELSTQMERWLSRQPNIAEEPEAQQFALWPFRLVQSIRPLLEKGRLSNRVFVRLLEQAIWGSLPSGQN